MIRILHIVSHMNRGGVENFLMNIYRKIDRKKIQFDFLMHINKKCTFDDEIESLGGRIYKVSPRNRGFLKNRKELDQFFKEHQNYKIVHQHVSSLSYIEPLKFAKKYNIPVRIVHSHNTRQGGNFLHNIIHKYNQIFIKSIATNYYACSESAAKWLYSKKQYENNNYKVINNAIDSEKFIYNENIREKIRNELNIKNKFVIGHVGRFHPQKNHKFLVKIFKEVIKQNKKSILLLVGDGKNKKEIEQIVEENRLSSNVMFTGVRSDVHKLMQAMDVFVLPSLYEGFPVTLVEAQASGLPCVLSENITKEVEINNNIKWFNIDDEPQKWANGVLALQNSRKIAPRKNIIESGFDSEELAKKLQNIYINNERI